MREKFFQKGSYRLRLDDIKPREAKPHKRIHLNCSMVLTETNLDYAPTRIRRVWEIVANPQLDTFRVAISSQLKGIDIEMFQEDPADKHVPLVVCLSNCILRDIHLDREKVDEKNWEVRLNFSLGISWDKSVWMWGEEYVFLECYAKFSQSQSELFDENEADREITPAPSEERERLRGVEVEVLGRELGNSTPETPQTPGIDPLLSDAIAKPKRVRKMKVIAGKGNGDVRPNA
jgi:hypothetical protein